MEAAQTSMAKIRASFSKRVLDFLLRACAEFVPTFTGLSLPGVVALEWVFKGDERRLERGVGEGFDDAVDAVDEGVNLGFG